MNNIVCFRAFAKIGTNAAVSTNPENAGLRKNTITALAFHNLSFAILLNVTHLLTGIQAVSPFLMECLAPNKFYSTSMIFEMNGHASKSRLQCRDFLDHLTP